MVTIQIGGVVIRHILLVLLFSGFAFSAGLNPFYRAGIIGGDTVKDIDPVAKSTVLLIGKIGRGSFTCSAVLIERDILLTAGHCLGAPGWAKLEAHFKLDKKNSGPVIPVVKQLRPFVTQAFDRASDQDDIAVLKLKTPAPANYQVATMITDPSLIKNGMTLIQAGYGRNVVKDGFMGKTGIGTLRQKKQTVINSHYGQKEFLMSIEGGGACKGDSGGPAYLEMNGQLYLAGIASRMSKNNRVMENGKEEYYCTKDMIFTFVPTQMNWIQSNIQAMK